MSQPNIEDFLPGIQDYLESLDGNAISSFGLEEIVSVLRSKTGLKKEICVAILCSLFHEIRASMLRGDIVTIRNLGKFYISSPLNSKNKKRVFAKFKQYKTLSKRINDL